MFPTIYDFVNGMLTFLCRAKTEAGLGPKKGRSQERAAFGDITNRESRLVSSLAILPLVGLDVSKLQILRWLPISSYFFVSSNSHLLFMPGAI